MAQYVAAPPGSSNYRGLGGIFEYVNEDGALPRFNCGQAAAATCAFPRVGPASRAGPARATTLSRRQKDPKSKPSLQVPLGARDLLACLERDHPPDNLGGWLGTSRRRVERALRSRGYRPHAIHGEERLRAALGAGLPVIITVQISVGRFWKFDIPSGHWMVAFGFDDGHIYLTNWWDQRMEWMEFRRGWHGWVPALTGMRDTGLIVNRG
ncbi:MAG: hypothetical protein U0793_17630 [Gemmataceae bacterium]